MAHHKKNLQRKSSSSSSSSSSETNHLRHIEYSLRPTTTTTQLLSSEYSSKKKLIYPNVPKRSRQQHDIIDTESAISIIPSETKPKKHDTYPSIASSSTSSNQNAYIRHTLDLITKYTSPQKRASTTEDSRDVSSDNSISQSQPTYRPNNKRIQSFDDDEDDADELSQLLDHRYCKKSLSQSTTNNESRTSIIRKPTARKLSTNQPKTTQSQPAPIQTCIEPSEMLIIEPDVDVEDEDKNDIQNSSRSTCPSLSPVEQHTLEESAGSLNSFLFETPCSSLSRATTTKNLELKSKLTSKTNHETQTLLPSTSDMICQLILKMNENQTKIDYNPIEISKNFFNKSASSFSLDKYSTVRTLMKKQYLNIGRYEIEIRFSNQYNQISTIYVCDICLKHFHGSSIAFQRHTSKCLSTQPPGKLVFNGNDLAIFHIGQTTTTKLTMEQRLYLKSLCRIARLFLDSKKSIDDTKVDQFNYYILCRRDPILLPFQSPVYRLMGYFSKQTNQYAQNSMNNLSCLFMLPAFAQQHQEYNQLLIAFSYFLIRLNASENLVYSSSARPLDSLSLSILRTYWRDTVLAYISNNEPSSIKTITLDALARRTFIHPKDILLSLYSCGFIVPHQTDKSCVYLRFNFNALMTSFSLRTKNDSLFGNVKSIDMNEQMKMITIDNKNNDKNHDNGIEEIVLD